MRAAAVLAALLSAPLALAGSIPAPTVLPEPGFPAPARDVSPTGPRLELVSSRYRDPGTLPPERRAPPRWAPRTYRGATLDGAVRQGRNVFLVYEGRYVVGADARTQELRYAFDFRAFTQPPNRGEFEPVTWAREAAGVLYVSNSHLTYASQTKGRNAYLSAIDLETTRTLWRSPALVANSRTFVVTGDLIVAGYGFTAEPDFLYLLDRRTGKVLDRLAVPSAPEIVRLRGSMLHVQTYDRQVVARIVRQRAISAAPSRMATRRGTTSRTLSRAQNGMSASSCGAFSSRLRPLFEARKASSAPLQVVTRRAAASAASVRSQPRPATIRPAT